MGNNSSTGIMNELSWNMSQSPQKDCLLNIDGNGVTTIQIICPLQGEKDKIVTIKNKNGMFKLFVVFERIHKVYKDKKIDHIFFEGLEFVSRDKDTNIYKVKTGS